MSKNHVTNILNICKDKINEYVDKNLDIHYDDFVVEAKCRYDPCLNLTIDKDEYKTLLINYAIENCESGVSMNLLKFGLLTTLDKCIKLQDFFQNFDPQAYNIIDVPHDLTERDIHNNYLSSKEIYYRIKRPFNIYFNKCTMIPRWLTIIDGFFFDELPDDTYLVLSILGRDTYFKIIDNKVQPEHFYIIHELCIYSYISFWLYNKNCDIDKEATCYISGGFIHYPITYYRHNKFQIPFEWDNKKYILHQSNGSLHLETIQFNDFY